MEILSSVQQFLMSNLNFEELYEESESNQSCEFLSDVTEVVLFRRHFLILITFELFLESMHLHSIVMLRISNRISYQLRHYSLLSLRSSNISVYYFTGFRKNQLRLLQTRLPIAGMLYFQITRIFTETARRDILVSVENIFIQETKHVLPIREKVSGNSFVITSLTVYLFIVYVPPRNRIFLSTQLRNIL